MDRNIDWPLSQKVADALRLALDAAYEDCLTRVGERPRDADIIHQVIPTIRGIVGEGALRFAHTITASSYLFRLPAELIGKLGELLGQRDTINFSVTCSYVRRALLQTPSAWTDVAIYTSPRQHPRPLLARSCGLEIDLHLDISMNVGTQRLIREAKSVMPRVRRLSLRIAEGITFATVRQLIDDILTVPAPCLRAFIFQETGTDLSEVLVDQTEYDYVQEHYKSFIKVFDLAPLLSTLVLNSSNMDGHILRSHLPLSNLTTLVLHEGSGMVDVCPLLKQAPNLKRLGILSPLDPLSIRSSSADEQPSTTAFVDALYLETGTITSAIPILERIQPRQLVVTGPLPAEDNGANRSAVGRILDLVRPVPDGSAVSFDARVGISWVNDAGQMPTFYLTVGLLSSTDENSSVTSIHGLPEEVLDLVHRNIRWLTISASDVYEAKLIAPVLASGALSTVMLQLNLRGSAELLELLRPAGWFHYQVRRRAVVYPKLKYIIVRCKTDGQRLNAGDVAAIRRFVLRSVGCDAVLDALTLEGWEAVENAESLGAVAHRTRVLRYAADDDDWWRMDDVYALSRLDR